MQKFDRYDYVHVTKDSDDCVGYLKNDCNAIVMGSYKDQYGGNDIKNYTLFLERYGGAAWYCEHQLALIEKNRKDLHNKWQADIETKIKQESDLDWIFDHGSEVLEKGTGSSIEALAKCLDITNLWGDKGEGTTYYTNLINILNIASVFLTLKDKEGWLQFCNSIKKDKNNKQIQSTLF